MAEARNTNTLVSSVQNLMFDSSILIAIITGILYLIGLAYRSGYLSEWGLSESIFLPSFGTLVSSGFMFVFNSVLRNFFVLITIFFAGGFVMAIWQMTIKRKNKTKDETPIYISFWEKFWMLSFVPWLVVIFLAFTIVFVFNSGKSKAKSQLEAFQKNPLLMNSFKTSSDSGNNQQGHFITCEGNFCAFWIDPAVRIVNISDITEMSYAKNDQIAP